MPPSPNLQRQRLLAIIAQNWTAETNGFHTYSTLAEREDDPARHAILRSLAAAEQHHAELWAARFQALGGGALVYTGAPTGEADTLAARVGGDALALRRLELDESRDIARYSRQLTTFNDPDTSRILDEVIRDEQEHYRALGNLIRSRGPQPALTPEQARNALNELIAARDKGQRRAASWVGDAIYGVNDGLGAIFGIVSGVSGATLGNSHFVLLAGLTGMVASALSMGSGAFLAAKSEREIFEAEYSREAESVRLNEAEAREMLSLSFQLRGLPTEDADRFVDHLANDPAPGKPRLVQALARERLDTTEDALSDPWIAAISGALSTAIGAFVPIIPFFFLSGFPAVLAAAAISLLAHFAVGAAKSLITIRSWWASGLEMTAIGAIEGVVTYLLGIGLGHLHA